MPPQYNYRSDSQVEVGKIDKRVTHQTHSMFISQEPKASSNPHSEQRREHMIEGAGSIKSMELKGDWQDATPHREWQESLRAERIFHPGSVTEVDLVLYYRGRPTSKDEGQAFQDLLNKRSYHLQPQDIERLERTLGDFVDSESSSVSKISTRELNGRQVVEIDGQWKSNNHQFRAIVMDADGSGCQPHQLYLMAPASIFEKYLEQFEDSIKTIVWK